MSEPISGTAAGVLGFKALGAAGIGAGLSALVVMCMMTPRSGKEWAVGLITTVISSVCGGAFVVQKYDLHAYMHTEVGLMSVIGLVFACGLPGWAIVRWVFNYIQKNRDKDIKEMIKDVKEAL